ncbi:MAG: methyltransferase [Polyangiaceae bacterium]
MERPPRRFLDALELAELPVGSYRTNVDAVLLAAFAGARVSGSGERERRSCGHAVDLGSGVGSVGLLLLHHGVARRVTLVEVDAKAHALAEANVIANGLESKATCVGGDVGEVSASMRGRADLVVSNPPYFDPSRGRSPFPLRARARSGDLGRFVVAARTLAGRRARVAFVYPADATKKLFEAFHACGLEPKRMRFVHATERRPARVVLVEAQVGKPGGLVVMPPFVERVGGKPTDELARLLRGEWV